MNKSYFCSERVRLRAMEPEDLEVMYAMENDSQTSPYPIPDLS